MRRITKYFLFPLFSLIVVSFSSTFTQQNNTERYVILGLSVEGNIIAEPAAIIGNSGLQIGDTVLVPGEAIRTAVSRLWALNIFSDVEIIIENTVNDGAYFLIRVEEFPRFARLEIVGNDELSEDDITKKIPFTSGKPLPPFEINKAIRELKKQYDEKGYMFATINYVLEKLDTSTTNEVVLKLEINEGKEVYVERIEFDGNATYNSNDLKSEFSETHEYTWWKFWSSSKFDKKKYDEDKEKLIGFYRRNGYKDFQIAEDSIEFLEDNEALILHLKLDEGIQYKVRNIVWEGNSIYRAEILNNRLGFVRGDVFDEEKFEQNLRGNQDQTDVASLYLDNGYLTFNAEPEEKIVGEDSIDFTIRLAERNQFRNGNINISGNTKTQDNVIRRELYTLPGSYFNRALMIRSIRQLSQLNYFNPEKIRPDYQLVDDKTVDLSYSLEEKSSDNVNASIGYSQAFGATGALGFTINNFSLREPFIGGAGQILNFEWQFGEGSRFRTFSLNFTEPWLYNTPTTVGFSIFDTRQIYYYDLRQTGISGRIGRRLKFPDDFFRGDWTVRYQQNNVFNGVRYYTEGKTQQFTISQEFSRNSSDSPIFPSQGSAFSISTDFSNVFRTSPNPSSTFFHKWNFSGEKYIPLFGTNKLVLYASTISGLIVGGKNDSLISPIEFFYMGGTGIGYFSTTPLRGYEDRSIGPRSSSSGNIGGKFFLKTAMELRFSVALNPIPIYVLGFAESGNVWDSPKRADIFDMKRAVGLGARILINPLGMVGFDYGYGFDDVEPRDGKADGWKFHFVFGRGF
ncbi:MAG: outer membrane protein assembly factor BamA [Bacteroidota bacterium]